MEQSETRPTVTDDAAGLTQLLADAPGALLVAEEGGEIVGTVIAGWNGWRGSIYRIAVAPLHHDLPANRIHAVGHWLLGHSSDRNPAKLGIALLSVGPCDQDLDVLAPFAAHDEFTLYAVVAAANVAPDPAQFIFRAAMSVHGWGRIHAVKRLAGSTDPAIKSWMLRTGFENGVMNEYLAFTAATTGDLASALRNTCPSTGTASWPWNMVDPPLAPEPRDPESMADLACMEKWPRDVWTSEIRGLLEDLAAVEPQQKTRDKVRELLGSAPE